MARPFGLLRAGFPYLKTLGMRRITNFPADVAFGAEGRVYILLRTEVASNIRVWHFDDAESLTDDLVGIGAFGKDDGQMTWPVQIIADADENRSLEAFCGGESVVAPGKPIDGIVRVLLQVGAGFEQQAIGELRRAVARECLLGTARGDNRQFGAGIVIGDQGE